jgi:hypothetical protein
VAVEEPVGNVRLHLVLFLALQSLRVARVVFAVGVDPRRKGDAVAIWRPDDLLGAAGKRRQWRRLAADQRNQVDLRLAAARREKREALAIG